MLALARAPVGADLLPGAFDSVKVVPWRRLDLAYHLCIPRSFEADRGLEEREVAPTEALPIGRFP